jgi:hypothetical protein
MAVSKPRIFARLPSRRGPRRPRSLKPAPSSDHFEGVREGDPRPAPQRRDDEAADAVAKGRREGNWSAGRILSAFRIGIIGLEGVDRRRDQVGRAHGRDRPFRRTSC